MSILEIDESMVSIEEIISHLRLFQSIKGQKYMGSMEKDIVLGWKSQLLEF